MRVFAVVMALLIAGSLLSFAMRGHSSPLTSVVGLITSPLQGLSASLAHAIEGAASHFRSSSALQQQLAEKEEEIARLREQLADYNELKRLNEDYQKYLKITELAPDNRYVRATIIGKDAAGQFSSFTLNRGSLSGIKKNDPVLDGQYLVGIISQVGLNTCTVNTILNPHVNVGVYESATNEPAVATAIAEYAVQGLCTIPQLTSTTTFTNNSFVLTSGTGGIYPKDLIVGHVSEVITDSNQNLMLTAIIQPAANFSSLRDVFVLIQH